MKPSDAIKRPWMPWLASCVVSLSVLHAAEESAPEDTSASEVPADAAGGEGIVPTPTDVPDWAIPVPEGMPLTADAPIPSGQENGLLPPADPFGLPVSVEGLDAADVVDSTEPESQADDRSFPWVAQSVAATGYFPGTQVPFIAAPSGFSHASPAALVGGMHSGMRDGLSLSAAFSGTYDSNPSQGYAGPANAEEADYYLTLGGGAAYRSQASEWTFGANYRGAYNQYFQQSELSGYNHSAGASLDYHGGPLTAGLAVGVDFGSGANRYYASVVDEIIYNYRLGARYKLSAKTSLTGDISQSLSLTSGAAAGTADNRSSLDLGVAALWTYSALTEFGPGIRYTTDSGDSELGRSSIGPTITANYKLSSKVTMNSRVGLDFAEYDDGTSPDPMVSMSAGLNYQASRLWGMSLSLYRDAQADPSMASAFNTVTALRLGYYHKIRRATLNLGLGYETNVFEQSGAAPVAARPDRDYLTLMSSLGMPIFSNTTMASIFLSYSDQSGGAADSWDAMQLGFSLNRSF